MAGAASGSGRVGGMHKNRSETALRRSKSPRAQRQTRVPPSRSPIRRARAGGSAERVSAAETDPFDWGDTQLHQTGRVGSGSTRPARSRVSRVGPGSDPETRRTRTRYRVRKPGALVRWCCKSVAASPIRSFSGSIGLCRMVQSLKLNCFLATLLPRYRPPPLRRSQRAGNSGICLQQKPLRPAYRRASRATW